MHIDPLPEGLPIETLATVRRIVVAEAEDLTGQCVRSRLHTPDGYTFTAESALTVVAKVLRGEFEVGFRTPAQVYGADFVLHRERRFPDRPGCVASNAFASRRSAVSNPSVNQL